MQTILAGQTWTHETGLNGLELTIIVVAAFCLLGFFYWLMFRG